MDDPEAIVSLEWLHQRDGGRDSPPSGDSYATTAIFDGEPVEAQFSIVLTSTSFASGQATLRLLVPENLPEARERLSAGTRLWIMEGRRHVADCLILSVRDREARNGASGAAK